MFQESNPLRIWIVQLMHIVLRKIKVYQTGIEFDPNIRHRMDSIDTKLTYRALVYKEPDYDP